MSVDKDCVWGPWSSYDECKPNYPGSYVCVKKRTRLIRSPSMNGGKPCPPNDGVEETDCACPGKITK